jgi:hypothetical protein
MNTVVNLLSGVIIAGYAMAGLFFVRFWRDTHDRLFGLFGAAFWLLCVQRLALHLTSTPGPETEDRSYLYLLRLAAFALIIVGILDKNRGKSDSRARE